MNQALNGNSIAATDPNFIHFTEEQTGVLLPSCPGYPFWLPQLQLTASGRLCFWNFPAKLYRSVISQPKYVGTWNFALDIEEAQREGKTSSLQGGGAIGNGGEAIPYPWNQTQTNCYGGDGYNFWARSCNTYQRLTQADCDLFKAMELVPRIYAPLDPYKFWIVNRQHFCTPFYWLLVNVQWYIVKYLKQPYNVYDNVPYTDSWARNLNLSIQDGYGDVQKFLNGVNFLVQPVGGPTFWDKVIGAAPLIIGGIATVMTMGAAAPALVAAASGLITSTAAKDMAKNQNAALQTAAANSQVRQNSIDVAGIKSDIAKYTGFWYNASDTEKKFIFFSILIVLLAIILIIKTKTK